MHTNEETVGGVPMVNKELLGSVDNSSYPPIEVNIQAAVWTPKDAKGPVPVVLEFGSGGRPQPPRPAPLPADGAHLAAAGRRQGLGLRQLRPTSIQADNGAGLTQGIIGLANKGQPRKADDWGALEGVGVGRQPAPRLLRDRQGRRREARRARRPVALWQGDDRDDGLRPAVRDRLRRLVGRRRREDPAPQFWRALENVASPSEYHWIAGNFLKYAGPLTPTICRSTRTSSWRCARRGRCSSAAATRSPTAGRRRWVDAKGMFLAGVHAGPVYRCSARRISARPSSRRSRPR